MSISDLNRDHHRLRIFFLLLAVALLAVLVAVWVQSRRAPYRLLQQQFFDLKSTYRGEAKKGIKQYFTCAKEVDRCPTCHIGIERSDLYGAKIPSVFRVHGPGLRKHQPNKVGCSACHGGRGRALDPIVAHWSAAEEDKDPMMREPYIQASCARCHVPGAKEGQGRLVEGARLYQGLGCPICHPLAEQGRGGWDYGPDLRAIGQRSLDYLKTSLIDPAASFSGSTMPSFSHSLKHETEAMVSLLIYLKSLVLNRLPDCGTKEKSRGMLSRPCADCHAGQSGHAGGRIEHRCLYLIERAKELKCANCHLEDIPEPGSQKGYCPLITRHREACIVCHDTVQ